MYFAQYVNQFSKDQKVRIQLVLVELLKSMVELFRIVLEFLVTVEMFVSMWQFEYVHYFQFVQQYQQYFVRIFRNDYETIYEIRINVQFHEAKNKTESSLFS